MRKELLYNISAQPYRESIPVYGWHFGGEEKTLAVMGAIRGDEYQQMYIAGRLIRRLEALEAEGALAKEAGILVIPCAAQFSMNVSRRFWPLDNTDINRMFPGYAEGETTQRLAHRIFHALQGYHWGVHLTSLYLPGDFVPHIRVMETGWQEDEEGLDFGLPYLLQRTPRPYDTVTLNYNWQVWATHTFSLYTKENSDIDPDSAEMAVDSILRFLSRQGLLEVKLPPGHQTVRLEERRLASCYSTQAGILAPQKYPGEKVVPGETIALILDPCTTEVREKITASVQGEVFFLRSARLLPEHTVVCRVIPE